MTTHQTAIDLLTHDLDLRSRSSVSKTTLARLRKMGLDLPLETRVKDLAAICHGLLVIPGVDRAQVIATLFKLAPKDETAGVTALVAMRPALLRVAIRISGTKQPSADTITEILALAWEHLTTATKSEPATPCSLVRFVWSKARTITRRERTFSRRNEALDDDFDAEDDDNDNDNDVSSRFDTWMAQFLGQAVEQGVFTRLDAEIVWLTIIIGFDMKELASIWGVSHSMLKQRRLTAMTTLRGYTRDLLEGR